MIGVSSRASALIAGSPAEHIRRRIAVRLLPFVFILYIINYLDRTSVAYAALGMARDLGFGDRVLGLGIGIFFLGYVLLQIPGAVLAERWSARGVICATMIVPGSLSPTTGFSEVGEKFIDSRFNYLYVTDRGRFIGAVSLHNIKSYLNTPELAKVVIAGDLLRDSFPVVRASASLIEALERFSHHDGERLPVVSHDRELVGSIAKTDVILALAGSTVRSATTSVAPVSR